MVNHELRCIFIAIPKTATTSIRDLVGEPVRPHLDLRETREQLVHEARFGPGTDPRAEADAIVARYFKFSVVRNPWDRAVSLYHRREGIQPARSIDFPTFVERLEAASDTCIHPSRHVCQIDWLLGPDGKLGMDRVLRFERLDSEWPEVAARLGIERALPHLNRNQGERRPWRDHYDADTRQRVADLFARDIVEFEYRFSED